MNKVIKLNKDRKKAIFTSTAQKLKISPQIIEKDFWVVYVLEFLFNKSKYKNFFVFKGGTCLSNAIT